MVAVLSATSALGESTSVDSVALGEPDEKVTLPERAMPAKVAVTERTPACVAVSAAVNSPLASVAFALAVNVSVPSVLDSATGWPGTGWL